MEGLCVKLFNSWRLKIDFLFPLRVSALRLEPPSHYLFLPKRGLHGKPWERRCLIYDFILLKPAIIGVSEVINEIFHNCEDHSLLDYCGQC